MPDRVFLRQTLVELIEADTGRDLDGRLRFLGTEQRGIAGQLVNVNHFRVTGKVNVDLWYDGAERLVHQEWLEEGHRAMLELIRVRR